MNENLNLVEILKDAPVGTKLYSTMFGECQLDYVDTDPNVTYPINVSFGDGGAEDFHANGKLYEDYPGECVLFPSKDQRDWSKFKVEKKKVKIELKPFYLVLVRDNDDEYWMPRHFSHFTDSSKYRFFCTDGNSYAQCIPYDIETQKLALTFNSPDVEYELTDEAENK